MDVLEERVVDQRLVVPATSLVDHVPKVLDHGVVQTN
jgi:hypothetical protein